MGRLTDKGHVGRSHAYAPILGPFDPYARCKLDMDSRLDLALSKVAARDRGVGSGPGSGNRGRYRVACQAMDLTSVDLFEGAGVLTAVKDKARCCTRACGPP